MNTGWNKLGQAFGGFDTSEAAEDGALGVARVESALMKARKERDELNALEELESTVTETTGDADLGRMVSTVLRAGKNPEQVTGAQLDRQKFGITGEAAVAGRGGNIDAMNAMLSVASGDPMVQNKVEGNTIISPYQADANARTTDIGAALAGKYNAQAGASGQPRASSRTAPKDPAAQLNDQLVKEVITRYGKKMGQDGADIASLTAQRDKELATLGVGPLVAPGTDPAARAGIAAANALPPGASEADAAAAFAGADAKGSSVELEQIEDRKSLQGRMYVKINGQWYEE